MISYLNYHYFMKRKNNSLIIRFTFFLSTLTSYFFGLLFYDSTSGLDFNTYIDHVKFNLGHDIEIYGATSNYYYYFISQVFYNDFSYLGPYNFKLVLNNSIQLVNFLLYLLGLSGLYCLFKMKDHSTKNIFLAFSILNFLPTAYYLRLTMKPEILAFALISWSLVAIDSYLKKKNLINTLFVCLTLCTLLTIKASITGMVLVSFSIIYRKDLKKIIMDYKLVVINIFFGCILFIQNFKITGKSFFSQPVQLISQTNSKWDNTADLGFFTNLDVYNLIANPFKHLHADSFISITLLDTISDYFGFFWNHREFGNYIAYDRIEFTNNFLVQAFLPQYISIVFTIFFYISSLIFSFKYRDKLGYYLLPLFGIIILVINSLGIPSKNFDPSSGDLFKVHYYSFLFVISFVTILLTFYRNKHLVLISFILVPLFLLSMGFPKSLSSQTQQELYFKYSHSEFCKLFNTKNQPDCNDSFIAVCSLDYLNIPYVKERFIPPTDAEKRLITFEKNGNIVNTSSSNECMELISDGYQYFDEFKMLSINPNFGKVNNFVFGLIVILLFKKFLSILSIIRKT
jgi:hypothetical protein